MERIVLDEFAHTSSESECVCNQWIRLLRLGGHPFLPDAQVFRVRAPWRDSDRCTAYLREGNCVNMDMGLRLYLAQGRAHTRLFNSTARCTGDIIPIAVWLPRGPTTLRETGLRESESQYSISQYNHNHDQHTREDCGRLHSEGGGARITKTC